MRSSDHITLLRGGHEEYLEEITDACKRYWRHGLFSNVRITWDKVEGDKAWLTIHLTLRPRVSDIRYRGVMRW